MMWSASRSAAIKQCYKSLCSIHVLFSSILFSELTSSFSSRNTSSSSRILSAAHCNKYSLKYWRESSKHLFLSKRLFCCACTFARKYFKHKNYYSIKWGYNSKWVVELKTFQWCDVSLYDIVLLLECRSLACSWQCTQKMCINIPSLIEYKSSNNATD